MIKRKSKVSEDIMHEQERKEEKRWREIKRQQEGPWACVGVNRPTTAVRVPVRTVTRERAYEQAPAKIALS